MGVEGWGLRGRVGGEVGCEVGCEDLEEVEGWGVILDESLAWVSYMSNGISRFFLFFSL